MTDAGDAGNEHLPAGTSETVPLIVGVIGIAIPVALLALAAVEQSTFVLVLAVIAMFCVGAVTLGFVLRLATDPDRPEH
jgi:uncharacterized membrane protein YczE